MRAHGPRGAGNSYGVPVFQVPACYREDTPTEWGQSHSLAADGVVEDISGELWQQDCALDFEDLLRNLTLEQVEPRGHQSRRSFVLYAYKFESNDARLVITVVLFEHP